MAYPPRHQFNPHAASNGPDLPEVIPANPAWGYDNNIHTDIEVSNVFIDTFDNNVHPDVPRLQVGDFGRTARLWQFGIPNFPGHNFARLLWSRRTGGKRGWYLPEQFTAEWDHVNYEPYSEGITNLATGAGTVGAYSERSNIFQVGMSIAGAANRGPDGRARVDVSGIAANPVTNDDKRWITASLHEPPPPPPQIPNPWPTLPVPPTQAVGAAVNLQF
ncbi:uncharacterized protein J7T55_015355 [Diaporthe amygdali]|uniref:uncharacterized protein n=1 Tax=Phomopsis amygdali TaxID=1214568 RepID=UPI0022FEB0A7|nr:uncharacterized protein J7T55_015355 [Diaporthe amygdali]KAJ0120625.1 uncharacterized protein J7T55_015355 [Diaporthe amygdali]